MCLNKQKECSNNNFLIFGIYILDWFGNVGRLRCNFEWNICNYFSMKDEQKKKKKIRWGEEHIDGDWFGCFNRLFFSSIEDNSLRRVCPFATFDDVAMINW